MSIEFLAKSGFSWQFLNFTSRSVSLTLYALLVVTNLAQQYQQTLIFLFLLQNNKNKIKKITSLKYFTLLPISRRFL